MNKIKYLDDILRMQHAQKAHMLKNHARRVLGMSARQARRYSRVVEVKELAIPKNVKDIKAFRAWGYEEAASMAATQSGRHETPAIKTSANAGDYSEYKSSVISARYEARLRGAIAGRHQPVPPHELAAHYGIKATEE